jgi:hypothetical protein
MSSTEIASSEVSASSSTASVSIMSSENVRVAYLDLLPPSVLVTLCLYLTPSDLAKFSNTNKYHSRIAMDEVVFRYIAKYRFGVSKDTIPSNNCWRQEVLVQKRKKDFKLAMAYGRLGRLAPLRSLLPLQYDFDLPDSPTEVRPTVKATSEFMLQSSEVEEKRLHEQRLIRQGTCSWSYLSSSSSSSSSSSNSSCASTKNPSYIGNCKVPAGSESSSASTSSSLPVSLIIDSPA